MQLSASSSRRYVVVRAEGHLTCTIKGMQGSSTEGRARGWAFIPTVISSIATFAGLLAVMASFYYGGAQSGQAASMGVFGDVRWLTVGLTLVAATMLALSLAQFTGRRSLLQGKVAIAVAVLVAVFLVTLLIRTLRSEAHRLVVLH